MSQKMPDPYEQSPGTALPLAPQIAAMSEHAKLISYLEQENSVLHSKLRSLEMKLEKAGKALAVEREACAKVAETWKPDFDAAFKLCPPTTQTTFSDGPKIIAQLIRGRGEK
jgi:hypothetical protein